MSSTLQTFLSVLYAGLHPCLALTQVRLAGLLTVSLLALAPAPARAADFINGALHENYEWRDSRYDLINAHDGGIIHVEGTYYWYGMALRPLGLGEGIRTGAATTTGVLLYSSKDLRNWAFEKVILPCSLKPGDPLYGPMRFERPKMVYNQKTKKFVLWFHYVGFPGKHGDAIGLGDAGVAVADRITDTFTFLGHQRPVDALGSVKDSTLFQDTDGSAYFIYDRKLASGVRCLYVVRLSDDYLKVTDTWARIEGASSREAPAVFKRNGTYFLITSGVTGWDPNPARYYCASNIMGPYTNLGDPCVGEGRETNYNSQPTYVFKVENLPDAYIAMFERHNTKLFTRCSYIWLPIRFPTPKSLQIEYLPEWSLDVFTRQAEGAQPRG